MNEISAPCFCGCGQLVTQPSTGRAKKYLNDAHRVAHTRRNKEAIIAIQSTPPTPKSPTKQPLTGQDGIDYSDPYKVLPPNIACYMPVQSHQTKDQLLALERQIHNKKPNDSDCKF